ncbi:MAG TPA: hypothetical protein VFM15_07365 [Gammaproteobacteria bacterium]|nr:hypothetical protein [Gammaproteobacteria bacterium]
MSRRLYSCARSWPSLGEEAAEQGAGADASKAARLSFNVMQHIKQHRDMMLTSEVLDSSALARYVESFGAQSAGWEFPAEKSALYEQACQKPSCCIVAAAESLVKKQKVVKALKYFPP